METASPQGILIGFYSWLVPMVLIGLAAIAVGLLKRDGAGVITGSLFAAVAAFLIWLINQ